MEKLLKDSRFDMPRGSSENLLKEAVSGVWEVSFGSYAHHASTDASLFSSSLPVLPHKKLDFTYSGDRVLHSDFSISMLGATDRLEDGDGGIIRSGLPNENALLDGLLDDLDLGGLPSQVEDLEDYDIFGSGGGFELENDLPENLSSGVSRSSISNGFKANGGVHYGHTNGTGTVAGEHPLGEHPSRTLFVRNINSNIEDSELRSLFEPYGDIRNLYTACKHRGFVIISYYDIRDAHKAMQTLQNKPLRRRKLDIHFSIPKENPSEKDINQGTLVVFNVDASVSSDALREIFNAHGEIKEIRETPNKKHQKFIEFCDVRDAEAALTALNWSEIAGKRIKVEYSRPGGLKRNFIQPLYQDTGQDEGRTFRHQSGSPVINSPPGSWMHFGYPIEKNALHAYSRSLGSMKSSGPSNGLHPVLSYHTPALPKIAPIGKDRGRTINESGTFSNTVFSQDLGHLHSLSVPDKSLLASSGPFSAPGESNSPSSAVATLSGAEFLWGSPPASYSELNNSPGWPSSPAEFAIPSSAQGRTQGFRHSNCQNHYFGAQTLFHVGSAPSGVQLERLFGFSFESPESSFTNSVSVGGWDLNPGNYGNGSCHGAIGTGVTSAGSKSDGTISFGMPVTQRHGMIHGNGALFVSGAVDFEGFRERSRNHRGDASINQLDSDKFTLDLDKIVKGEDTRTTLMIKNIPNKYTSKMLLTCIDEHHRGTYDFLYLPIDFKNKCNVGYAFINMVSTSHVVSVHKTFNGKKWDNFNSGKIASLAYARIQGRDALINHFQNSSLMNEDKWCRPIVFHLVGQEATDKEYIGLGNLNVCVRGEDGTCARGTFDSPTESQDYKPE